MITCDHCGREYNADEYLQCPDDSCEGGRESLHELAQQILLLCIEISRRGLADAFCSYSGHVDGLDCYVRPKGFNYQAGEPSPKLIEHLTHWSLAPRHAMAMLRKCHQQLTDILAAGKVITLESMPRAAA